jgi:polyhydroxyalkanoate synthesis regulator phasin
MQLTKEYFEQYLNQRFADFYDRLDRRIDDKLDRKFDEKLADFEAKIDKKISKLPQKADLEGFARKADLERVQKDVKLIRLDVIKLAGVVDNLSGDFSDFRDYATAKFMTIESDIKEMNGKLDATSKMAKEDADALAKNYLTLDRRMTSHDRDIKKLKDKVIVK